jgi:hypothetical protein
MSDYTASAIEGLRELHAKRAGTPEFVRGGPVAADVLRCAIAYLEGKSFDTGAYGGPMQLALHAADRFASPSARTTS